jgi:GNAT superfamily N-acetyltransferase
MGVEIRDISGQDATDWRGLWAGYLDYHGVMLPPEVTDETWTRILDPASELRGRVALLDGKAVGFALYHSHLSTWASSYDCYLEDLFVTEVARGLGIGRALVDDLIGNCRTEGYARLYWHADKDNARARRFYDSYTPTDGHVRYRVKV